MKRSILNYKRALIPILTVIFFLLAYSLSLSLISAVDITITQTPTDKELLCKNSYAKLESQLCQDFLNNTVQVYVVVLEMRCVRILAPSGGCGVYQSDIDNLKNQHLVTIQSYGNDIMSTSFGDFSSVQAAILKEHLILVSQESYIKFIRYPLKAIGGNPQPNSVDYQMLSLMAVGITVVVAAVFFGGYSLLVATIKKRR